MSIEVQDTCTCDYGAVTCHECMGAGVVIRTGCDDDMPTELLSICPECDGTGHVPCPHCRLGVLRRNEE